MPKTAILVLFLIVLGATILIERVLFWRARSMARERFPDRVREPWLKTCWNLDPSDWWPFTRFLLFRQYEDLGDPELTKRYDAHRRAFALYSFVLLCSVFVLPWASAPGTSPMPTPAIEAGPNASDTAARFEVVFNRLIMTTVFGGGVLLVLIAVAGANVGAYAGTVLPPGEGNGPPSSTWSFQRNDWRTMASLWRRDYKKVGDAEFTRRYDRYRLLYFALPAFVLFMTFVIVLVGLTFR